jgi:hypothetical protein
MLIYVLRWRHLGFPIGIKNRNFVEDLPMIIPGQFEYTSDAVTIDTNPGNLVARLKKAHQYILHQ